MSQGTDETMKIPFLKKLLYVFQGILSTEKQDFVTLAQMWIDIKFNKNSNIHEINAHIKMIWSTFQTQFYQTNSNKTLNQTLQRKKSRYHPGKRKLEKIKPAEN